MRKLRELLADGDIALLAVVFALGTAVLHFADSISRVIVAVFSQLVADEEFGALTFGVFGTTIYYETVLATGLALVVVSGGLAGLVLLLSRTSRTCPECLSDVPSRASVCRYCTAEIGNASG